MFSCFVASESEFAAEDGVEPAEVALMRFARSGGTKARTEDPVVEETLLRLVPICKSLSAQETPRNQTPRTTRAKFEQEDFDNEIRDQLCGLLADYLQSDQRVQIALRRFRRLTSANAGHMSGARMSERYILD